MSEEKDSYDALALVSKGIIERLERELLEAKEYNQHLVIETHLLLERHAKAVTKLKHDLDDMTQLAMTYKDANNTLEGKLREMGAFNEH